MANPEKGEMLVISQEGSIPVTQMPYLGEEWAEMLNILRELNEYLLTGQSDLYFEQEKHLWQMVDMQQNKRQARAINSALAMSLMHCAGNLPQNECPVEEIDHIRDIYMRHDIPAVAVELHQMAEILFEIRGQNKNNRQRQLVTRINEYIAEHMDGDLSLVAIADAMHFHPVYLSRIYKEHAGISLSDYIANQRLNTACILLRTSQTQVSAIAKSTGFTSSNYFSRWFRKHIGLTPQEYRDKAISGK